MALLAVDPFIRGDQGRPGRTFVGLRDGKFLRGELGRSAEVGHLDFIGVNRSLQPQGLLVQRGKLVVLALQFGADGADFALTRENTGASPGSGFARAARED